MGSNSNTTQGIIGGVIGWIATLSTDHAAQAFAAAATGFWMITQAVIAITKARRKGISFEECQSCPLRAARNARSK